MEIFICHLQDLAPLSSPKILVDTRLLVHLLAILVLHLRVRLLTILALHLFALLSQVYADQKLYVPALLILRNWLHVLHHLQTTVAAHLTSRKCLVVLLLHLVLHPLLLLVLHPAIATVLSNNVVQST